MSTQATARLRTALAAVFLSTIAASGAHAADDIQVRVKNKWDKTIVVYVYNGKDTTRWSTAADFNVEPGATGTGTCRGQGKGRCYVRVLKDRGNKPVQVKWGGWVQDGDTCTVPKNASGKRWNEITCN